jgi:predicted nuclease of predicted toxin-antitoxin system
MALRFLADHCVSNSTVQSLREAHHEVLRLKDVLPVESSDTVVIAKAQEIDAILLSLNGDFSHIVNYPPKNYKGIVAMQMHNHPEIIPKLIARLTAYLKMHTTAKCALSECLKLRVQSKTSSRQAELHVYCIFCGHRSATTASCALRLSVVTA